ncbi:unnamed protein product [Prunus brigantina]
MIAWNCTSVPILLNCGSPESYSGDSETSRHLCKFVEKLNGFFKLNGLIASGSENFWDCVIFV